jgi:hypothetical protein
MIGIVCDNNVSLFIHFCSLFILTTTTDSIALVLCPGTIDSYIDSSTV